MILHTITLTAVKSPAAFSLTYAEQPVEKKQKRFRDRVCLEPQVDLKAYTCRAVVDWVDIRFRTVSHTQWRWIKRYIDKAIGERVYVEKKQLDDDGKYRDFRVRIQEPVTKDLLLVEEAVRAKWDLVGPAAIVGLEVSVDFTPREPSDEALALMFGVLVRGHLPSRDVINEPPDRPRFAWDKGKNTTAYVLGHDPRQPDRSDAFLLNPAKDRPATIDSTYYAGAEGSRCAWRTMIKLLDRQNIATGTREVLPEEERRVRIEITVDKGELDEMGIRTIEDLASFKFQRFQGRYFKFVLPTFPDLACQPEEKRTLPLEQLREARLQRFLNAGVVGLEAWDEAWRRKKKQTRKKTLKSDLPLALTSVMAGSSSSLRDYNELTRRVIQALRHIDGRMRLKGPSPSSGASDF
ncbi:hypothetical protein [Mesorhizobium sp. M2C.T.Ca.TU.002.02.1.1]|uniref:hypothetical protein n=1 Tax=Mesorhizobium sp. M2C.T.Ca.TU.002.02.1.1 TaxID=2496788 RepID=UPI000FCB893D|nr:hypothetical protein [Mesorhizobium sp. M2C.T.Ca.TU.002.02.1.1]RUU61047.1 hypothetical protein EOD07_02220 [Mesorhizobium sp. M2C.T.Ca.TU.002.02.1.1]RUU71952.1 hypothetical protein EOD04_00670 [Mesorhizobium sp. M2C.T.Ca.TU.009.01.2.1]